MSIKLEHVNCDLCGSEAYRVRYRKPDNWLWLNEFEYPVVECKGCGLVYVNPRPDFEQMGAFYPVGYHDDRDDAVHLKRYKSQYDYIENIKFSNVLDIGCARGDWLNYIGTQRSNVELQGVDAFSSGVNGSVIKFHSCALTDAKLESNYFDLVTSWAVIEHVHTPNSYFEVVSKVLRPGGKFVFLVTNSESIYGKYAFKEDVPRHLYHFNEKSIGLYAKKHGLTLESISYDERFWDGTGSGAFYYLFAKLSLISWHQLRTGNISFWKRCVLKLGAILDKVVFSAKWEQKLKMSGIIVVTMSKEIQ